VKLGIPLNNQYRLFSSGPSEFHAKDQLEKLLEMILLQQYNNPKQFCIALSQNNMLVAVDDVLVSVLFLL
jgi:hypothetical protein